ncbi:MAG TPA: choice-of-anchor B family protein [candidate division Zixibacteria bacterium]|nr:choice-of-anchor B family protein [candidate division Zixibacteria bacterium]
MRPVVRRRHFILAAVILLFALFALSRYGNVTHLSAQDAAGEGSESSITRTMQAFSRDLLPPQDLESMSAAPCVGGMAGSYPCDSVDLLAFMPLATFSASSGNDSWGWTDSQDGSEYALMGLNNGTAFVDISDPENPIYLGKLPTHTQNSSWRDIKVYADHAFIGSEAPGHGMQIFDLSELGQVTTPPVTFSETAYFSGFGSAHNIVINEDSGYAYGVGTNTCSGGLHIVDISNPTSPVDAGCFSADGYTHDAQCVIYNGPDADHQGSEICVNANEDTVTIVDVTDKNNPTQLSRTGYQGSQYTHQGWLTEDHRYYIQDDELDEYYIGHNTRTRVWDVSDLDSPVLVGYHDGRTTSIDHNLYTRNGLVYEANYRSGLSILEIGDLSSSELTEIGYFDIYPANDNANFNGAWSVFPYFESGNVIVSGIEQGLFILRPILGPGLEVSKDQPTGVIEPGNSITYTVTVENVGTVTATNVVVTDTLNGVPTVLSGASIIEPEGSADYLFIYVVQDADCYGGLSNKASASASDTGTATTNSPVVNQVACTYFNFAPKISRAP